LISKLHSTLLSAAIEKVLSKAEEGAYAYVHCLSPTVVEELINDPSFSPSGWSVLRVADGNLSERTISSDKAVELREDKKKPILLLIDTSRSGAGAGIDSIKSAAQEINERSLFNEALSLALKHLDENDPSTGLRAEAELAIKTARGYGNRFNISPWSVFDFIVSIVSIETEQKSPGGLIGRLGLWPISQDSAGSLRQEQLDISRFMVDRLLGIDSIGMVPRQKIAGLRLACDDQIKELDRFLREMSDKTVAESLSSLSDRPELWINTLKLQEDITEIQEIILETWRGNIGQLLSWSGLQPSADPNDPPVFILDPDSDTSGDYAKLEVRWKVRPESLGQGAADYHISIVTDMNEELAYRDVSHVGGRSYERCSFSDDDFAFLNEDAQIGARVVVTVPGYPRIEDQISEDFTIKFGDPSKDGPTRAGKLVRTFSEGLIESDDRQSVTEASSNTIPLEDDGKGTVVLRTADRRSYKVFRPELIRIIDELWPKQTEIIGRWRLPVRITGEGSMNYPEFVPLSDSNNELPSWSKVENACRKLANRYKDSSSVGQIYDQDGKDTLVRDYLSAWTSLLAEGSPSLALANTVEVYDILGKSIGLIVLPSHPLRIAWHSAYDNLVIHSKFEQGQSANDVRKELSVLNGAMYPPFLPALEDGSTYVFGDTLGFHAVGMIPDSDKEPRASISILQRALSGNKSINTDLSFGRQTGSVLGKELLKYMDSHQKSEALHVHALRAGDGLSVARGLSHVQSDFAGDSDDEVGDGTQREYTPFVLEFYPSGERRNISGRFLSEIRQKRRTGLGEVPEDERWMLESISKPGGVNVPKLRWAKKESSEPEYAAHVAIAFDTFESTVEPSPEEPVVKPYFAYGLLSYLERSFTDDPSPVWLSSPLLPGKGAKHPAGRGHTDKLMDLQKSVGLAVSRSLGSGVTFPRMRTEITPEKAEALKELHDLCGWVLTIDRNSGIEYFDSPKNDNERYKSYVIDCVPEREDMGSLQLITSTSYVDEVRSIADAALDQMGLSRSNRNAEFLLDSLKSLSGRLAMRLTTGQNNRAATSELIALALVQAHCKESDETDEIWTSLKTGFFVPVDDILDLIPEVSDASIDEGDEEDKSPIGNVRPDLIYVSVIKGSLSFRFIEVKHRGQLKEARRPKLISDIKNQTEDLRERWSSWYLAEDIPLSFRALRLAKLARVLRFYADKAKRHHLLDNRYSTILSEIDRMVEKASDYKFPGITGTDRGWIFCPRYEGETPELLSDDSSQTKVFIFGPNPLLPDSLYQLAKIVESDGLTGHETDESLIGSLGGTEISKDSLEETGSGTSAESEEENTDGGEVNIDPATDTGLEVINTGKITESKDPNPGSSPLISTPTSDATHNDCTVTLGEDSLTGLDVHWRLTTKGNPHLLVAGLPGMGKTTFLERACVEMLGCDVLPIVFSYHQDIDEKLQEILPHVRFVDFEERGFNPLQIIGEKAEFAHLEVSGKIRDMFMGIYPELGNLQGGKIRNSIRQSFVEVGWEDSNPDFSTLAIPEFGRFLEILKDEPKKDAGLKTLLERLDELESYGFFNSNATEESLWDSEHPVVIRIHKRQDEVLQKAFASMMFFGLYKDMSKRGIRDRITHSIIFDEAHRAARMKLIPIMAKECRKFGISLVLASQEARDFDTSVFSAIANYLVFRLNDNDARALVHNVASSSQEKALIDKIKQTEQFRAHYFSENRKPSLVNLFDIPG